MSLLQNIITKISQKTYTLSPEQIIIVNRFVSEHSEIFGTMSDKIRKIDNGRIDYHNIPQIISIIVKILHNKSTTTELENPKNIIEIIKFILDTVLESDVFLIPDLEEKIIKNIVDSSLKLLEFNVGEKYDTSCCLFFK